MKDLTAGFGSSLGTGQYHRHFMPNVVYTDGVKEVCEHYACYWILDVIASYAGSSKIRNVARNKWEVTANDGKASAVCIDQWDNEGDVIIRQEIDFTDLPDGTVTFHTAWNGNLLIIYLLTED